jgi:hypothetical protein
VSSKFDISLHLEECQVHDDDTDIFTEMSLDSVWCSISIFYGLENLFFFFRGKGSGFMRNRGFRDEFIFFEDLSGRLDSLRLSGGDESISSLARLSEYISWYRKDVSPVFESEICGDEGPTFFSGLWDDNPV